MTKQDKELLIKDLCARLQYGVLCCVNFKDGDDLKKGVMKLSGMFTNECYFTTKTGSTYTNDFEPYLRPMSSMTDKERKEINELVESESSFLSPVPTWHVYEENIQKYVDFCLSHHLDWRGMIPKGLAIEAPDGMYNF